MATIFLAEDDPLMVSIYSKIFKVNGFDVHMALDGEKAIVDLKAMSPKPDIVVLDVMMPKKDGFQVLTEMKGDAGLKDIPVIILTNLSGKEDLDKGRSLGADLCLVKSQYGPEETAAKIKEVYEKRHPAAEKAK